MIDDDEMQYNLATLPLLDHYQSVVVAVRSTWKPGCTRVLPRSALASVPSTF